MHALRPLSRQSFPLIRQASGGPIWYGRRWVEIVRSESNILTVDDPPTSPLPETHELLEGKSDFSNWVDTYEDVSTFEAVVGLGSALAFCYGIYRYSVYRAEKAPPKFTLREFPNVNKDLPTWSATHVRKE